MPAGIEFECPECGRVTRVPVELAGKQGRCAGCRRILLVPDPQEDTARLTGHLRQTDAESFQLTGSAEEDEPDPPPTTKLTKPAAPAAPGERPAWDFAAVPIWLYLSLLGGVVLPVIPVVTGIYAVVAGQRRRQPALSLIGWVGLTEFAVIWTIVSYLQFRVFLLPLVVALGCALAAVLHSLRLRQV